MDNKFIILIAVSAGTAAAVFLLYQELQRQRKQARMVLNEVKRMQEQYRKLEGIIYATNLERFGHDLEDAYSEYPLESGGMVMQRQSRTNIENDDEDSSSSSDSSDTTTSDSEETDTSEYSSEEVPENKPSFSRQYERAIQGTRPVSNRQHPSQHTHQQVPAFPGQPGHPLFGFTARSHQAHPHQALEHPLQQILGSTPTSFEVISVTTEAPETHTEAPVVEEVEHSDEEKPSNIEEIKESVPSFDLTSDDNIEVDVDVEGIIGGAQAMLDVEQNMVPHTQAEAEDRQDKAEDREGNGEDDETKPTRVYKDTALNRKLNRVGKPY